MKKTILITLLSITTISLFAKPSKADWKLVWSDEFNGKKLDTTKWSYQIGTGAQYGLESWGNNEQQYYTNQNLYLKNGKLVIEARKEETNGKPYSSSRIRTVTEDGQELFTKKYGRFEARIKMPSGDGIWPAFWLLPATNKWGYWASSGEIDIMEAKGRLPNRTYGTIHFGSVWPGNMNTGDMYKFPENTDITDYHVYALEWEPGILRWFVDDNLFYETSAWWGMNPDDDEPFPYPAPFDVPFYVILNLAVGGNFDENRIPDEEYDLPAQMFVDYVRVYEKKSGYNYDVKAPVPPRDTENFEKCRVTDNNFISDSSFSTVNLTGMTDNQMDKNSGNWYLLALNEFGGKASAVVEDSAIHVKSAVPGNEVHSVQLIQHLGIAKGYTYEISFDAKASAERKMAVKLGGDDDNKWAVYSRQYSPKLETEYKHFKYRFTMENDSDLQARLEFNMGIDSPDVWIKNIIVKTTN